MKQIDCIKLEGYVRGATGNDDMFTATYNPYEGAIIITEQAGDTELFIKADQIDCFIRDLQQISKAMGAIGVAKELCKSEKTT